MKLIDSNNGFQIFFDCDNQTYNVFKDGKYIIGGKHKYSDVKCYID